MKKLYIFLIFIFTSFQGFSQFYEGFEGESFPPAGWMVTDNGVGTVNSWVRTNLFVSSGNWNAYMTRENIGMGNTSQDWLITPQITVSSFNEKLFFSSRSTLAGNHGTLYQIRVSTAPIQSDLSNYIILQTYTENQFDPYQHEEKSLDLQGFAGQSIYIAFVHIYTQPTASLGGDRWVLDDIYIAQESMYNPNNILILNAFLDLNNNGIKEANEQNFSLGKFSYQFNSQPLIECISNTGLQHLYHPFSFTYNLNFQINPAYSNFYSCNTTHSGTVSGTSSTPNQIFYFPVSVLQNLNDVEVNIIPFNQPRPGFIYTNAISYKNNGNHTIPSGIITFTNDSAFSISTISPAGTNLTPNGFTYNYTNLGPFESRTIYVSMLVPEIPLVNLGDLTTNSVAITPITDSFPTNNVANLTRPIVGSYDPNDKMENHGPTININEFGPNDYLYYTIRFENTGTAAADFVIIKDSLHSSLNPATFEMIESSHTYNATRLGNQIEWFFNDINLPPTSQDPNLSHGFVHFKIKPNAGFAIGDIIPNTAEIYFDYNPAIITNTFETEFVTVLSVTDRESFQVVVYPNPTNETVHVELDKSTDTIQSVTVYDLLGKQLISKTNVLSASLNLDISSLKSGTYLLEISNQANLKTTKKLVIQ